MTEDFDKMARIEREIEKRMESACEKDGWVVSVAMMPPESTTLHIEKFGESPIAADDEKAALDLNCNLDSVDLFPVEPGSEDEAALLALLREHISRTASPKARRILAAWQDFRPKFSKVIPAAPV